MPHTICPAAPCAAADAVSASVGSVVAAAVVSVDVGASTAAVTAASATVTRDIRQTIPVTRQVQTPCIVPLPPLLSPTLLIIIARNKGGSLSAPHWLSDVLAIVSILLLAFLIALVAWRGARKIYS